MEKMYKVRIIVKDKSSAYEERIKGEMNKEGGRKGRRPERVKKRGNKGDSSERGKKEGKMNLY